jgi:hypothetical protein
MINYWLCMKLNLKKWCKKLKLLWCNGIPHIFMITFSKLMMFMHSCNNWRLQIIMKKEKMMMMNYVSWKVKL